MPNRIVSYSAIGALLLAVLTVLFPAALILLAFSAMGNVLAGLIGMTIVFVLAFLLYFVVLYGIGWVFSKIPRSWGVILAILLIALGILFLQPELDVVGLFGFLFAFYSRGKRPSLPK